MRTLVVVPTYDERGNLEELVGRTLAQPLEVDVLIVDDASPDGTGDLADQLALVHPQVQVHHRTAKAGLGSAYRHGLGVGLERGYDVLVEMDADLSHDPSALPQLVGATAHADLVIGSRYVPGGGVRNWARRRLALSSGGNRYVQLVTGLPVRDATSGYRAFRADVLRALDIQALRSEGYSFQVETALGAWRAGFRIAEVPITFTERRAGASKISRSIVLEAMWRVALWGLRGPRRPARVHPDSVLAPGGTSGTGRAGGTGGTGGV